MKNNQIILTAFICFLSSTLFSQINYQAVLRDTDNIPISDSGLEIAVTITQDGTTIYSETHSNVSSAPLGILNLAVGAGIPTTGVFDELDWSLDDYEVIVSVDGDDLPSSPIRSVPIAEYAKNSSGSQWNWNPTDSILSHTAGRVGIGTTEIENTILKIQGTQFNYPLGLVQGDDGANHGMAIFSPNSVNSGRFFLNDDMLHIGRGANPTILSIANSRKVGINVPNPTSSFHVNGLSTFTNETSSTAIKLRSASSTLDTWIRSHDENDQSQWVINMCDRNENNRFGIYSSELSSYLFLLNHDGKAQVRCLEILGGCDLKEDFNSTERLEPGDVVILDAQNPGELIRSASPYDKKVAGVISGANGINPGLSLSQDDRESGEFPLAMVGQVYVKATGKVEVGDMLTTSHLAGHAMAVNNFDKANGTVIGKAMSAQDGGEGFVLLLVNLQ